MLPKPGFGDPSRVIPQVRHRAGAVNMDGDHARDPREAPFQIGKLRSVVAVVERHFKNGVRRCVLTALVTAVVLRRHASLLPIRAT
ncbi:hypothetical protein GCM10010840_35740 [Deinococcus aerolatus]|uniref:Transposase n=1 Tax=Deinococcus aerolatus TaxID=522487 RepID=A0ABQ2GGN9_9DEIO|nr:hypothetical protein GCM10010840_35740 [Deinococcus aerolatus]